MKDTPSQSIRPAPRKMLKRPPIPAKRTISHEIKELEHPRTDDHTTYISSDDESEQILSSVRRKLWTMTQPSLMNHLSNKLMRYQMQMMRTLSLLLTLLTVPMKTNLQKAPRNRYQMSRCKKAHLTVIYMLMKS